MDQRASTDVVYALQQMGFEREACVAAAVACNNDVQASTEWLLAAGNEAKALGSAGEAHESGGASGPAPAHVSAPADAEQSAERAPGGGAVVAGVGGESWQLVGGHPLDPLNAIAGADQLNIHDTGMGGWVVMHGAFGVAEPLLFVGERSTWYGKVFAGRSREAVYDLLDTSSRPLVTVEKTFSLTSTSARVSLVPQGGDAPVGPAAGAQADPLIGTITSEWDAIKRRLLLVDSTPNHAAGAIALESPSIFDDTFRIKLGDAVLGTVTRPR